MRHFGLKNSGDFDVRRSAQLTPMQFASGEMPDCAPWEAPPPKRRFQWQYIAFALIGSGPVTALLLALDLHRAAAIWSTLCLVTLLAIIATALRP